MNAAQLQQLLDALPQPNPVAGVKLRSLERIDPDEWRDWRIHFETAAETAGWQDLTQRRQIKLALGGEVAAQMRDLAIGNFGTAAEMLNAMEARIIPAAQGQAARAEYQAAKQLPGETLMRWHARLRTLFLRAYPGQNPVNNVDLRENFISGIIHEGTRRGIYTANPANYQAALAAAQAEEATEVRLRRDALKHGQGDPHPSGELHYIRNQGGTGEGCYLCNQKGHFKRECPLIGKVTRYLANRKKGAESFGRETGNPSYRNNYRGRTSYRGRGRGRGNYRRINQVGEEGNEVMSEATMEEALADGDIPEEILAAIQGN